jgi:hypothetical protein
VNGWTVGTGIREAGGDIDEVGDGELAGAGDDGAFCADAAGASSAQATANAQRRASRERVGITFATASIRVSLRPKGASNDTVSPLRNVTAREDDVSLVNFDDCAERRGHRRVIDQKSVVGDSQRLRRAIEAQRVALSNQALWNVVLARSDTIGNARNMRICISECDERQVNAKAATLGFGHELEIRRGACRIVSGERRFDQKADSVVEGLPTASKALGPSGGVAHACFALDCVCIDRLKPEDMAGTASERAFACTFGPATMCIVGGPDALLRTALCGPCRA